jgi:hypothetical protein
MGGVCRTREGKVKYVQETNASMSDTMVKSYLLVLGADADETLNSSFKSCPRTKLWVS